MNYKNYLVGGRYDREYYRCHAQIRKSTEGRLMISVSNTLFDSAQSHHKQADQPEKSLAGRVLLAAGEEMNCVAHNMTVQSAEIIANGRVEPGQIAVFYFDQIGIITGKIKSKTQSGYYVLFLTKENRRERIAARLEWHFHHAAQAAELRRAPRIRPLHQGVEVRLGEQIVLSGTILDISISGAAIKLTEAKIPFVGARVRVGRRFATVVRLIETGIAVQFIDPFASNNFDERVRP